MARDFLASFPAAQRQWGELQAQWQASKLLRWGVWASAALFFTWILLVGLDHVDARSGDLQALVAEQQRLKAVPSAQAWSARADEAGASVAAFSSMAWAEPDLGLSEAALQDALRSLTARLGLTVRELRVVRVEALAVPNSQGQPSKATGSLQLPEGHVELRARLVLDLQRGPVMLLLAELARSERSLVVDRMVWRGTAQPPQVEMELRALARVVQPAAKERP
ncbi:MAG: hypothetical protein ACK5O3_14570 [Burkholderiales bacterium]|jgi:hypothetical protein